jgi:hypothetical protein
LLKSGVLLILGGPATYVLNNTTAAKKIQVKLFRFFRKSENLTAMRKNFWRAIYDTDDK